MAAFRWLRRQGETAVLQDIRLAGIPRYRDRVIPARSAAQHPSMFVGNISLTIRSDDLRKSDQTLSRQRLFNAT